MSIVSSDGARVFGEILVRVVAWVYEALRASIARALAFLGSLGLPASEGLSMIILFSLGFILGALFPGLRRLVIASIAILAGIWILGVALYSYANAR
jgi:hypothetical protein